MFGKKNFWFVVVPNYVAKTLMKSHFNFKLFKFQVNKTNFRLNVKKACEIVKVFNRSYLTDSYIVFTLKTES